MARLRRDEKQGPNALVAAAQRIDLADTRLAQRQAARRQKWQEESWAYFYEVPEVGESLMYRANQLAKLRLFVAVANPDDPAGDPIAADDEDSGVPPEVAVAAGVELARLHGEYGGQAEIMRMLSLNQDVAAECYLVGIGEHEVTMKGTGTEPDVVVTVPEDWTIRSISEVLVVEGVYKIKDGPTDPDPRPLVAGRDDIMRIWLRDPQYGKLPHCSMRGLLGECRTLQVLSQQVLGQAMRAVSAGFFTVPNELSFGPNQPTDPEGEAAPEADPLNQALNDVLVRPIDNPADPSVAQPGVIRGAAEFLRPEFLRRISFYDPAMDTVLEAKIDARVARIARGINLPVEKVMGHQQTTYANAAQVDEDEFNDYLRPSADVTVDSLTFAFLRPQLAANPMVGNEWADGRLFIWYDASDLIAQPDKEANADKALELGAISLAAYRKAKGYDESDAPDAVEELIRAGLRRGILTADLTLALMDLLGVPIDVQAIPGGNGAQPSGSGASVQGELLQVLATLMRSRAAGAEPIEASAQLTAARALSAGTPDYGQRLVGIDQDLRTRLLVAANDTMGVALDRAGAVLRAKAQGTTLAATLRPVSKRQAFAHLGPTLVAEVLGETDPLAGAWDALQAQFMEWGANAQSQALDVAGQVAAGFAASVRSQLQLRQAADLGEAWTWMAAALTTLALAHLFNPDPAIELLGEFDPNMKVPTGLVRQAMARAGGATGLSTQDGGVWLPLTDAGTRPAGGIGTGELLRGAMRDEGAMVEAYQWVYGPAYRQHPFEPHLSLDGVVFQNFDDAVLANTGGWPEGAFYLPGDHSGCVCDFEPIIVPVAEVT